MPWESIEVNANAEGTPWISIGVHGRANGYSQAKLTMSRSIVKHLRLNSGDQLVIQSGTDDKAGWVRLIKAVNGMHGFILTSKKQGKGNLALRMTARHLDLPVHSTTKITTDDAGLILKTGKPGVSPNLILFELPEWARKESA